MVFQFKMAFIVGAKRTAFGAFGKSLKALSATELATKVCGATDEQTRR